MKKRFILFPSMCLLLLSLFPFHHSMAQSPSPQNKWFIGVTSDYHRPIWTKDFQNFLNQNSSHTSLLAGAETYGWEVGMPIPTTQRMKIIASASTSYNSLLFSPTVSSAARHSSSTLSVQTVSAAIRYMLPLSTASNIFSVDLGVGYYSYAFSYYNQLPAGNIAIENLDGIFTTTTQSLDIKQQLWNFYVEFIYEFKISQHLYIDASLNYSVLAGNHTIVNDPRTSIDNFPTMSRHRFGISLGINYYFNNL